jgi:hypothetical protein
MVTITYSVLTSGRVINTSRPPPGGLHIFKNNSYLLVKSWRAKSNNIHLDPLESVGVETDEGGSPLLGDRNGRFFGCYHLLRAKGGWWGGRGKRDGERDDRDGRYLQGWQKDLGTHASAGSARSTQGKTRAGANFFLGQFGLQKSRRFTRRVFSLFSSPPFSLILFLSPLSSSHALLSLFPAHSQTLSTGRREL